MDEHGPSKDDLPIQNGDCPLQNYQSVYFDKLNSHGNWRIWPAKV